MILRDPLPRYWLHDEEHRRLELLEWNDLQLNFPECLDCSRPS